MSRPRSFALVVGALMVVTAACGTQTAGSGSGTTASASPSATTSTSSSSPAPTTAAPTPTQGAEPQRVYWEDVEPGMCLDEANHESDTDVWVVPCTTAHDREVMANVDLPGTDTWPGDHVVSKAASAACTSAFKKYVGTSYNTSDLSMDYLLIDQEGWEDGDHTLICLVHDPDHTMITHPLKGSRQ